LDPEERLLQQHTVAVVRTALEQLPVDFREVIVLREIEGLSYKEIAAVVGGPIGTVMSRLARARERLLTLLKLASPRGALRGAANLSNATLTPISIANSMRSPRPEFASTSGRARRAVDSSRNANRWRDSCEPRHIIRLQIACGHESWSRPRDPSRYAASSRGRRPLCSSSQLALERLCGDRHQAAAT